MASDTTHRPERLQVARITKGSPRVRWSVVIVAVLTALAFALRVREMRGGLYGDELYTLTEVTRNDLFGLIDELTHGPPGQERVEDNPPLYFILAWLSAKVADPTAWIRLPSLLAGTATVPAVYLLALRTVGRRAGVVAAGVVALSPFAMFYGSEARPYALLMFCSTLSTLLLLTALDRRRAIWWAAYGLAVSALIYTHYTGAVIVGVHGLWALWSHPQQRRPLLVTYAVVAVSYLPWVPYIDGEPAVGYLAEFGGPSHWDALITWVMGSPAFPPTGAPGALPLVLLGCGLGVALLSTATTRARPTKGGAGTRWRHREHVLVVALAAVAPVACLLYGIGGTDLFLVPRNMSASLPFLALGLGAVLTLRSGIAAAVAVSLAGLGFAIGAARTLEERFHRPNFRAVARVLEDPAKPRGLIVYYGSIETLLIQAGVKLHTERPHRSFGVSAGEGALARTFTLKGEAAVRAFVVADATDGKLPPPVPRWQLTDHRIFQGFAPVRVLAYKRLRTGAYELGSRTIRRPTGGAIPIASRPDAGVIDVAEVSSRAFVMTGWASSADHEPVDRVLGFIGSRLVAAGIPTVKRPDVGAHLAAPPEDLGYQLAIPKELVRRRGTKVSLFAVSDGAAAPLPYGCNTPVPQVAGC